VSYELRAARRWALVNRNAKTLDAATLVKSEWPDGDHNGLQDRITTEPDKRGGKPCIRGLRITVYDVLEWLAAGQSWEETRTDFPALTDDDIRAVLEYAASREHTLLVG